MTKHTLMIPLLFIRNVILLQPLVLDKIISNIMVTTFCDDSFTKSYRPEALFPSMLSQESCGPCELFS